MPSLNRLIVRSLREEVIDQYSIDQDGSNVLVIADCIHYLSDADTEQFLLKLLMAKGMRSGESGEA